MVLFIPCTHPSPTQWGKASVTVVKWSAIHFRKLWGNNWLQVVLLQFWVLNQWSHFYMSPVPSPHLFGQGLVVKLEVITHRTCSGNGLSGSNETEWGSNPGLVVMLDCRVFGQQPCCIFVFFPFLKSLLMYGICDPPLICT